MSQTNFTCWVTKKKKKKANKASKAERTCLFHSRHERLSLHYAQPLVPLIFFSALVTAHPPSSLSTLWSAAGCTHAPLIGSSAPSGVSWMRALLTRIGKAAEKLLRWGGSGKATLGFWLFVPSWLWSGLRGNLTRPLSCMSCGAMRAINNSALHHIFFSLSLSFSSQR